MKVFHGIIGLVFFVWCVILLSGCESGVLDDGGPGTSTERFTVFHTENGLANDSVMDIAPDYVRRGVWLATRKGVSFYSNEDSTMTAFGATAGEFPSQEMTSLLVDYTGSVWVGTVSGPAYLAYGESLWQAFPYLDQLAHRYVTAVKRLTIDNSLWFGTRGGITVNTYAGFTTYLTELSAATDISSLEIVNGAVWAGSSQGLRSCTNGAWTIIPDNLLPSPVVTALFAEPSGVLWIGTAVGIVRYNGSAWTRFGAADGLPGGAVNDFTRDSSGLIWAATDNGACFYDGTRWRALTLPGEVKGSTVRAVAYDSAANAVWFGTYNGAVRYMLATP